jgi:LPXTG-motif cell wall anchor domain protein
MKKILASIIIAMMLISVGVNVFADETKSTEQTTQTTSESTSKDSSITLKITEKVEVEDVTKEVKVVIGYDKLESIDTSGICMFKGIFKYSDVYFNQLTQNDIKALNGYTVQFSEESGRLLVEANRTPKDGEDVAEITLTFKEGLENVTTTGVFFEVEELTDGKNEYDTPKLVTQVAVVQKADKTEETKDEQKNTETTKDDNKKDELEIITNTTKTDNTTEKTTQDTTVSQEKELPKTGATTVALIVLAVVAIGTISLIRYKNIEIK